MTYSIHYKVPALGRLLRSSAVGALLCAAGAASAGVLNFEAALDSPFLFNGSQTQIGDYWVEAYNGTGSTESFVGAVVDNDACSGNGLSCPINNATNYLATLDDGYFYFGLNSGAQFQLKSLQASFIGAGQASFPSVAGVLVLQGFHANGTAAGNALQLGLAGPAGGAFNFTQYDMGAFGDLTLDYVRILGYACPATGSCTRTTNWANYAIDNLVTVTVPEPASWGLMGLGLLGLAAASRRRRA